MCFPQVKMQNVWSNLPVCVQRFAYVNPSAEQIWRQHDVLFWSGVKTVKQRDSRPKNRSLRSEITSQHL